MQVVCRYCGREAVKKTGGEVYPHLPNLKKKIFWVCDPCDARVGCHGLTDKPLGDLANAELRKARSEAHRAFDPLWKTGTMTRSFAYAWLSKRLGINEELCHIGMFDAAMCRKVVEVCNLYRYGHSKDS